ncbi:hypothetical protein LOY43_07965 [Pseudomonas sp. B21-041]|uniref:hypothetical protein n=1 Tax=Pseudomonas TaxID=286 RepID=UPI002160C923|nr:MULTISPECIES: hypothetical protein [Pseudomonas]UVL36353.1 hypothetical protein LOY43_07965 [Pseudomonas sp. B21-041]WPN76318.1 hypothetical protein QMK46_08085 [Pseudomonas germanica]
MSVQVNSLEANAALALYPVYPPQWITPVLPPGTADGGLPLSAFIPSGVELVIDPITGLRNWVMAAFDVVTILVNGVSTGISKTIYPGEEQERILLRVPASWFTNGVNDVRYRVARASGNDDNSPTLKLLYNNPAPTVTVSHPPSVVPGQTAVLTITVTYPRPHDTVKLTIGTWSITFPNPTNPINHTLTAAELLLIGDGTHSVFATVRDQLTNNNESAKTPINITANQKVYNSPIILEAVDGMLDVAALKGQDATLRARDWTGLQVGQQVWLKFTGQKPDGSAHVLQFWNGGTHKVNATWVSQRFWDKPLLIAFLRELNDGSELKLEFWVSEDKSNNFASATRFPDQVYTVRTVENVEPTIDSIKGLPSNIEIPDNDDTVENSIILIGTAAKGQQVDVIEGDVSKGKPVASPTDGEWRLTLTELTKGRYTFVAKAQYADNPTSKPRSLTVHQPLQIDQSNMILNGYRIYTGWATTGLEFLNNSATRTASYGVSPVTYMSSNTAIATVDMNGKVIGLRNGNNVVITVQDKLSTLTYNVYVSNIFRLDISTVGYNYQQAISWRNTIAGSVPLTNALTAMRRVYGPDNNWPLVPGGVYRMCDEGGCPSGWGSIFGYRNGGVICHSDLSRNLVSWCLRPY